MNSQPIPLPSRASETELLSLVSLPPNTPLDKVFRVACEKSAAVLGVERVGVWLFIDNKTALRCATLYERSKDLHTSGAVLRVADYPTYFASLKLRKAVPSEVATTDPWTAELRDAYLTPLGISSMLDAGLFLDAELVGVLCHEHIGPPREWTTEVRDFAAAVADRLVVRIRSAEAQELRNAFLLQQERQADLNKAAALEQFAAGVAHDFRSLLAVILGTGEMFQSRPDVPDFLKPFGTALIETAERGVALANQLMEYARPANGPQAVQDLPTLTSALLPALRALVGSKHHIESTVPAMLGRVMIEQSHYDRILTNLIANARDAMPQGGTIRLRLAAVRLTGDPTFAGRYALVEITDSGMGMAESVRERIFEPYFTTKPHGTGLGLAIVNQIVQRVGGLVRVESQVGVGTTIRLFLPCIGQPTGETMEHKIPVALRV